MFFHINKTTITDYSFLATDMHNHILPGIDDGATDTATSLLLLGELYALGFSKIIPTPHTYQEIYPNTPATIGAAYDLLQKALEHATGEFPIVDHYGSEYMMDGHFTSIRSKNEMLSFAKDRVLVEMSFADNAPMLLDEIFQIQLQGKIPVLAHPERYTYLFGQPAYFEQLIRMGCELQLNLLSLLDHYGKGTQKTALHLLDKQWYSWAGTETHHIGHIQLLKQLTQSKNFQKIVDYPFLNKGL
jgi:tyrosine-protein phosphatase YwqE